MSTDVAANTKTIQAACAHLRQLATQLRLKANINAQSRDDLVRYAFLIHTKHPLSDGELAKCITSLNTACAKKRTDIKAKANERCDAIIRHIDDILQIHAELEGGSEVDGSDDGSISDSSSESDTCTSESKPRDAGVEGANGKPASTLEEVLQQAVNTIAILVAGGRWDGHAHTDYFTRYANAITNIPPTTKTVVQHIMHTLPISKYTNTLQTTITMLQKLENATGVAFTQTTCMCSSEEGLANLFDLMEVSNLDNENTKQTIIRGLKVNNTPLNNASCWSKGLFDNAMTLASCNNEPADCVKYTKFLRHVTCILLRRGYGKLDGDELHSFLVRLMKSDKKSGPVQSEN
jgi:hypothetical protein